ncbi:MAG: sensor histidine kinase [Actinomycetales bacterium]
MSRRPGPAPAASSTWLSATDAALLRRSTRRLALQTAALVALVVVVLLAVVAVLSLRQQLQSTDSLLRRAVATADDVGDPHAGTWLAIRQQKGWSTSPGLPPSFPVPSMLSPAAVAGRYANVEVREQRFRVYEQARDGHVVAAITDVSRQREEQGRTIVTLGLVGLVGLLLSGVLGRVLARRAVAPLVDALTLQRQFVADASHELRAPLTLLSTRVQLLARSLRSSGQPGVSPRAQAEAEAVSRDTARLVDTVEDLMLSAEPRDPSAWRRLELQELAREVVEAVRGYATSAGVELRLVPGTPAVVLGTDIALRRALLALLDNAVTHTPSGGSVTVTIGHGETSGRGPRNAVGRQHAGIVHVDVTDTGSGINPANVDDIFRRFHSGGARAGRRSYGLGLSLAQSVAHRHDGDLRVERTGADGTTFRLVLPAAP